jgi:hypothetical protein
LGAWRSTAHRGANFCLLSVISCLITIDAQAPAEVTAAHRKTKQTFSHNNTDMLSSRGNPLDAALPA